MPVTSEAEPPTGEDCRDEIVGGCPQPTDTATVARSNISFTDIRRIRRTSEAFHYALKWARNKEFGDCVDCVCVMFRQRSVTMVAPQPPASAGASRNSVTKGVAASTERTISRRAST